MLRASALALMLALSATLALAAPAASAISCAVAPNPLPPSPVGGTAGAIYTFERDAAWTAFGGAVLLACAAAGYAIGTLNAQCVFFLGFECISVA